MDRVFDLEQRKVRGAAPPAPAVASMSTPTQGATGILAVQQAAGNRAVEAWMGKPLVLPPGMTSLAPIRNAAFSILIEQQTLRSELNASRTAQKELAAKLEGRPNGMMDKVRRRRLPVPQRWEDGLDFSQMKDDIKAHEKKQKDLERKLDRTATDLDILTQYSSPMQVNEVLARRNVKRADSKVVMANDKVSWKILPDGSIQRQKIDTDDESRGGTATSTTTQTTSTAGFSSLGKTSTKTTTHVTGDIATTDVKTNSNQFAFKSDALFTRSKKDSYRRENTSQENSAFEESTSNATTIHAGGVSRSTERVEKVGDVTAKTKFTDGVSLGEGKVGLNRTTSHSFGQVDKKERITKGSENTDKTDAGYLLGPDGIGAYAEKTIDHTYTHRKGVKTGFSVAPNGRFTVNVNEIPGDPPKYEIVLVIRVGGKLGVKGGLEKETVNENMFSLDASGSISGGAGLTFRRLLTADETTAYLKDLNASAGGASAGKHPEFAILKTFGRTGGKAAHGEAKIIYDTITGSTENIKAMNEGDSLEVKVDGTAEGKIAAGGKSAGTPVEMTGVGVEFGLSRGGTITLTHTKKAGKIEVSVLVADEAKRTLGATFSRGVASTGYTDESKRGGAQGITLTLDPTDPAFDVQYTKIRAARRYADIEALLAKYPTLVVARTHTVETGNTGTTKAEFAGIGITITSGSARSTKQDIDAKGVTVTEKGSNVLGGTLGIGTARSGSSTEEAFTGTVTPDNKATGDSAVTTRGTNFGATVQRLGHLFSNDPIGLITGGAKVAQEDVNVAGIKLSDEDFQNIKYAARDSGRWTRVVTRHANMNDWLATGKKVRAAGDDKAAIAKALADFVGMTEHGRAEMIRYLVRPADSATGGVLYEFPQEIANYAPVYNSYVFVDPLPDIVATKAQDPRKALANALAILSKLDSLNVNVYAYKHRFKDPVAYSEMVRRIGERRAAVATEVSKMQSQTKRTSNKAAVATATKAAVMAGQQVFGPLIVPIALLASSIISNTQKEEDEKEKEAQERSAGATKYNSALGIAQSLKEQQDQQFDTIEAEGAKQASWFSKPDKIVIIDALNKIRDIHKQWDPAWATMKELSEKWGFGKSNGAIDRFRPDKGRWQTFYNTYVTW